MITIKNKNVLLYKSFTYSKSGHTFQHYYCSKKLTLKCKAKVKLDKEGKIEFVDDNHNHQPPKFHKSLDGKYHLL